LLVADDESGALQAELELATITRLGEGVDRTRALSPSASERTLSCLARYRAALDARAVERLAVVGTSALRDARGGDHFLQRAAEILGVTPQVISGREEAELSFEGALSGLAVAGNVCVFDIGGGSTEIVTGRAQPLSLQTAVSLELGSVRLFERHVRSDPQTAAERDRIVEDVRSALERAPLPASDAELVGVAGTVTQLASIHFGLAAYDSAGVHGARLDASTLLGLTNRIEGLPLKERCELPGMEQGRADVIAVGARILLEILHWSKKESLIVSDRGVRWGLAMTLARGNHETKTPQNPP
jgi:exopolyphosphatase/guanosine-5'-triphosphate,3'-diphosphate pyrophosphatase